VMAPGFEDRRDRAGPLKGHVLRNGDDHCASPETS
jgi:hypothetical protein